MSTEPTGGPTPEELVALEQLAVELAVGAGTMVRDGRPGTLGVHHTKSTDLDVVTVMDTRSEAYLRERLAALRPDDGILGEEGGGTRGRSGLTWVLDPIDGTVNYLYDLPGYAVSVAVVEGDPGTHGAWRPLAGAVAVPRTGEVFHARRGGGARLSRFPVPTTMVTTVTPVGGEGPDDGALPHTPEVVAELHVGDAEDLGELLVATGFAYDREVRRDQATWVAELLPRVRDIRRLGAAAVDLCHVAAGRVDAYYETGVQAWDVAAGWLVVTEAGGVVSGETADAAPSPALAVAGGPGAHATLRAVLDGRAGDPARTDLLG